MAEICYGNPQYLVLHFESNGTLWSTKVCKNWRGAQMSKIDFEKFLGPERAMVKILPLEAILRMRGIEAPETSITAGD